MGLELNAQIIEYLRAIGWAIAASIGFSLGISIALTVFDKLTPNINQWSEIKAGNYGASLIITSIVVMIGVIVYRVI
ncbi:MAG: DUF350 domain-containing protein [Candidatus Marinimicrobia bacterium]|nr:DUF350 domain-containing protein [Candidatus Neomarinimicrobiota bacterium]